MAHFRLADKRLVSHDGRLDMGLLLALALTLIAASPFITRAGLPRGTDAELHVFRAAELGYSLRAGDLYPRWAPDFYYGYGYPIFNYYAPLTYYLANLLDLLPGVDIVGGVKLAFILGLVCAGAGIYLFVRDWIGPRAGVLAAALYVFSPYVLFVDPHMRGVLAESFSLGLFPLALWAFRRVLVDGRRRWLVVGGILQAALIMSHNLMAAVFTAMLWAYLAWELGRRAVDLWRRDEPRTALAAWWPTFRRASLVVALGVGLSAIFWLPMALERGEVQLNLTGPGHFDFHNHFLTLKEMLAPSPILDLGAAAPDFALNLGLPQWPLALVALPALVRGVRSRRRVTWFFVLCSVGLTVLMLPLSTPIWERVPGMRFLQFPWRLLGPAAATLSIAAAAGFEYLNAGGTGRTGSTRRGRWGAMAPGLGIGLTLWLALPTMFPPLWEAEFGPTDPAAMIEFELSGVAVGTTSTGDYLPMTVEVSPRPEPAVLASYAAPEGVDKVNRATLPADTVVEKVSHGPTHDRFHVESGRPFILRLFTFYFPGWRATIDGEDVPIKLGRPEGFITVNVPAGRHTVEVRLGALATGARAAGTLISLLSLVTFLAIGGWGRLPATVSGRAQSTRGGKSVVASRRLDRRAGLVAGGVVLAFVLFKGGFVDRRHDWFRYASPPGEVLGAESSLGETPVGFGQSIQLLGYDLPRAEVRAGDTLPLTLYWRATAPVPDNYQVFAHLVQPATHLWGQSDNLNPGNLPTGRWPLDKYVRDEHALAVLPGTPPGDYQLTVGLYTLGSGTRVPVFAAVGEPVGDTFTLPSVVRVQRPRRPPSEKDLGLTEVIGSGYAGQITLVGAALPDRRIELPGFVHLALLWRSAVDGPEEITVRVQLVGADGTVAEEVITPPVDGRYPAPLWREGEVVRDLYSLWLDRDFGAGGYELRVGVQEAEGWVSLGTVEVVGP